MNSTITNDSSVQGFSTSSFSGFSLSQKHDSQGDDAMVDFTADLNCGNSSSLDEEILLSSSLAQLRSEMKTNLELFSRARASGDEDATDAALVKLGRTKRLFKSLEGYSSFVSDLVSANKAQQSTTPVLKASAGLSLSHRDLPKFQLSSSTILPYPREEAFESVDHFLQRFEDIINGSSYSSVESVWRQFLPLCLPHSDHDWVSTDLKKCNSWYEAKLAFQERHGSNLTIGRYTDKVFTMKMSPKESIAAYSKRFLLVVLKAGLPKNDPRIADRFLSSLVLNIQTLIRITLARVGSIRTQDKNWTVEFITQVGRDIFGDNNKLYNEIAAVIPGTFEKRRVSSSSIDSSKGQKSKKKSLDNNKSSNRVVKNFHCSEHGRNKSHNSKDCLFLKKNNGAGQSCRLCGLIWLQGHTCQKKSQILDVSSSGNQPSVVLQENANSCSNQPMEA